MQGRDRGSNRRNVPRDFSEFMAACAAAYRDTRRNAVEYALGELKRVPMTDAIEQYILKLARNAERRDRLNASGRNSHSGTTRLVLLKIQRSLGITYLDELTAGHISTYLDTYDGSAKTVRAHKSVLGGLIRFSRAKEWLSSDPLELLDSPDLPPGLIEWVKLEDFQRVLDAVKGLPVELPVALAGLAGIRRCEIVRLAPKDWKREEKAIHIRAQVSKVNRERYVPVSPDLEDYPKRLGKGFGPSLCAAERKATWNGQVAIRKFRAALRTSGILTEPNGRPLVDTEKPFNVLRHGAITYWLDQGEYPDKVAYWAGNSLAIIERHYRGHRHKPQDAERAAFRVRQAK